MYSAYFVNIRWPLRSAIKVGVILWFLKALEQENVAFCNIDQTRLGETLEGTQYVTASLAYLRLRGRSKEWFTAKNRDARYDYLYSKESLQKVKGKIENM